MHQNTPTNYVESFIDAFQVTDTIQDTVTIYRIPVTQYNMVVGNDIYRIRIQSNGYTRFYVNNFSDSHPTPFHWTIAEYWNIDI